jgi:recombinational DNA repair ATPase RecF
MSESNSTYWEAAYRQDKRRADLYQRLAAEAGRESTLSEIDELRRQLSAMAAELVDLGNQLVLARRLAAEMLAELKRIDAAAPKGFERTDLALMAALDVATMEV